MANKQKPELTWIDRDIKPGTMPTDDTRHFHAHSLHGEPPERWQPLEEHLRNVAKMAEEFAKPFASGDWAWNAGWLHDLGSEP